LVSDDVRTIDELTAPWLSQVLHGSVPGATGRVVGVQSATLDAHQGAASSTCLLKLELDDPAGGLPQTLVAKSGSSTPSVIDVCKRLAFYQREVRFYSTLSPTLRGLVPACYHAEIAADERAFLILLEHVSDVRIPDQLGGCSWEDAVAVITLLARMHARYWRSSKDGPQAAWPPTIDSGLYAHVEAQVAGFWAEFERRWRPRLDQDCWTLLEAFPASSDRLLQRMARRTPLTLCHYDARAENILFGEHSDRSPMLVDWAMVLTNPGIYDIAFFLATSLTVEQRRRWERDLLERWVEALHAGGVPDYGLSVAEEDLAYAYLTTVFLMRVGAMLDPGDDTHVAQVLDSMLIRCVQASVDWAGLDRLRLVDRRRSAT
jgi:hypothetical protein